MAFLLVFCLVFPALADTISVATFNVWSGLTYDGFFSAGSYESGGDRTLRFVKLIEELDKLAPDVIAINEANPLPNYARDLASELDYQFIYNVARGGIRIGKIGLPANLREGDAILAREDLDLEKVGKRALTGGPSGNTFSFQLGETCQAFVGKISVSGKDVYIFTTQWTSASISDRLVLDNIVSQYSSNQIGGEEFIEQSKSFVKTRELRLKQAELTLDFINELAASEDVILMGSLNALPDSAEIRLLKNAGFKDAFTAAGKGPGATYDAKNNLNIVKYFPEIAEDDYQFRLDYIMVRGDSLKIKECKVILNNSIFNDSHFSDHYGVMAKIEVSK